MDHAEAWWYLSKDEKKRWHETHRWPARMAGVLRRPEEGGFDCAFEVSAASSDLPGAFDSSGDSAFESPSAFEDSAPPTQSRSSGCSARPENAAGNLARKRRHCWGYGYPLRLGPFVKVAPLSEEPEESEAFLRDVAAAMAEEITEGAGESRAALDAGWTIGRGVAPWLAIAAGEYGWKDTERRNRVCIRETKPCSCPR